MLTLGIDPGLATTGYGVVKEENNKLTLVDYGCVLTSKSEETCSRLNTLAKGIESLIKKYDPDAVAVEELFFASNAKTAIKVGEARGVILLTASQTGVDIAEYTPLQVKQALTGYGRAEKHQIQYMVQKILGCKEIPKPDDAADALAIAICHINSQKLNKAVNKK